MAPAVAKTSRWTHRPEGSTWGDWGEDDQIGRLNLLTPAKVLEGAAEVKEGISFCLSLPLDIPKTNWLVHPQRYAPKLSPTVRVDGSPAFCGLSRRIDPLLTSVGCDDRVDIVLQYSTQWDSLAHVGALHDPFGDGNLVPMFYNGFAAGKDIIGTIDYDLATGEPVKGTEREHVGALKLGVENMASKVGSHRLSPPDGLTPSLPRQPIQGRAVMIDIHAHYGNERKWIGYKELKEIMDKDKVVVEPGDMVCFHTGFAQMILDRDGAPTKEEMENSCAVLDGRDPALRQWVTDSGAVSLIADNFAVEGLPSRPPPDPTKPHHPLPLHEHALFKLGVNLGEFWYLTALAKHLRSKGRSRFFLTAPPLNLPKAVGSPANAVGTV
ncbi:hypothetical protein DFJ74DRAFT_645862 [Hyaloraphidium curvatum]|nr:hypothetical protein DFJ74DRAFT_645862 [Hyaloraphidium curvatum]